MPVSSPCSQCGRSNGSRVDLIPQRFMWQKAHGYLGQIGPPQNLQPWYNIAPGQNFAVVRCEPPRRPSATAVAQRSGFAKTRHSTGFPPLAGALQPLQAQAVSIGGKSSHRTPPLGHKSLMLLGFCGELRPDPEIEHADSQQQHAGNRRRAPIASPGARHKHHETNHGAERRHRKGQLERALGFTGAAASG